MKKLALLLLPATLLLASCTKTELPPPPIDESVWLQQPRGVVVESGGFGCDYFIVQNAWGYSVLKSFGAPPYTGSVIYGQHASWGYGTFYNRSDGYLFRADVVDYGLGYYSAWDQLQWYCDPYNH